MEVCLLLVLVYNSLLVPKDLVKITGVIPFVPPKKITVGLFNEQVVPQLVIIERDANMLTMPGWNARSSVDFVGQMFGKDKARIVFKN